MDANETKSIQERSFCLVIAGTRTYNNFIIFNQKLLEFLSTTKVHKIISGGARGTDTLAEIFANDNDIPFEKFLPDWERHGKFAGILRNRQMADTGDFLLAFWNGKSRGTENMIEEMRIRGKGYIWHKI